MIRSMGAALVVSAISMCVTSMTAAQSTAPSAAPVAMTIDLKQLNARFEGWGTSLCWWANRVGDWPDAKLDALVHDIADPVDGLGLTVFRYNIGGGDRPDHHHMRAGADLPSFKPTADGPYDWKADERQRRVMLKLAKATKDPIIEAFANSAPWWMTISGCAAGSVDGGPNLPEKSEKPFADYLADVAKFYRDTHGITFYSVEPFNEPDAKWWKTSNNQEGMHVDPDQQARVIRTLRAALDAHGLDRTLVSAPDSNNLDAAVAAVKTYDAPTVAALGHVSAHSYFGSKRADLRELATTLGKPLWQSETGPLYVGGSPDEQVLKTMARLVLDVNEMRPSVWCMWQASEGGPWGAFHEARDKSANYSKARTFFTLALFTRAVRPGDRFVRLEGDVVTASVSASRGEATIFIVNREKSPRQFDLKLAGNDHWPATAAVARTSAAEDLVTLDPVAVTDGAIHTTVPAESITRFTLALKNPAAGR